MICLVIVVVATAGALGGSALAARLTGMKWRESLQLGALMNTRGLMELIALNIGYDMGILSQRIFTMLVIMALVTTIMTGPLVDFLEKYSGGPEHHPNRSLPASSMPCAFQVISPRVSGADESWGAVPNPQGEQRLRPLEVVRYSDVDEEPGANQPIDPAFEKAWKNLPLQRDDCPRWQVADDLFSKQINAGVNQTGTASDTFFEKLGDAAVVIECHTSIATNIGDCLQHDHQIGIFAHEQFQHWNKAPLHVAVAVENKNRVVDEWFGQLECSACSQRLTLSGVADTQGELVSTPEVAFNFLSHVARSQNHVTDSLRPESIEQQLKKRRPRD